MILPDVTVIVPAAIVAVIDVPTPITTTISTTLFSANVDLPAPIVAVFATAGAQGPLGATGSQGPTGLQGATGPQGIQGPGGAAGAGYIYTQTLAASVWTISHNLGFRPAVAVQSTGGAAVNASTLHLSLNVLIITFVTPFAGFARLS